MSDKIRDIHIRNKSPLHRSCKSAPTSFQSTNCHYPHNASRSYVRIAWVTSCFCSCFQMRARSHRVFARNVAPVRNTQSRKPNPIYQPRPQDKEQGWRQQNSTCGHSVPGACLAVVYTANGSTLRRGSYLLIDNRTLRCAGRRQM